MIRLVNDGAKVRIVLSEDALFKFYAFHDQDTTTIESPWTTEEAGELLKLREEQWRLIVASHPNTSRFVWYLHDLITLSLSFQVSGLSREDFISKMGEYNG